MKIVSPAEAVADIRSGDRVYVQCAAAAPSVLLDALVARAPELRDVDVVHLHIEGPGPHLAPEMAGHFRHTALFIGPNARAAVNEGRADYVPVFLSDVPSEQYPCASGVETLQSTASSGSSPASKSCGTSDRKTGT